MPISIPSMFCHASRNALLLLFLSAIASPSFADYLSDLEAEADNQNSAQDGNSGEKADDWTMKDLEIKNSLQPNLPQDKFEQQLRNSFIGSYTVYSRLNDEKQALVYAAYQDGVDIDEITRLIRELYNKQ